MEAYSGFAQVYDAFMDNIPYQEWSKYLIALLNEYGILDGIVLDLGCGTGKITRYLSENGYDMIGIDNSEEMLSIARDNSSGQILYLLQDMREFELFGTVRAVVSVCDSINYIMSEEELYHVFLLVNNYLDEGGIFIFDINTEFKYKTILADNTIAENREDKSFIWENYYYEEEHINEYDLTIYIKETSEQSHENVYHRYDETHYQKSYSLDCIKSLLEKAGMEYVMAYDAFTKHEPRDDSERLCIIAREKRQENKWYNTK